MEQLTAIQIFEGQQIRIVWNEEEQEYYFSIADVVQALTDSVNVKDYIKKMLKRDPELKSKWGTICPPVRMVAPDGKNRLTQAATMEGVLRVIQSIPSKKAEPLKQWLAKVGSQRIDQMIDPELTFQMAVEDYRRQGYSDEWINERMKSIMTRKELTDEWKARGIELEQEYAILTNEMTRAWSGMSVRRYKEIKGLKKENLRDNMTNLELVLNMLAEVTTTAISRSRRPETFDESRKIAKEGGNVARDTRRNIEQRIGHSVISTTNAEDKTALEVQIPEVLPPTTLTDDNDKK